MAHAVHAVVVLRGGARARPRRGADRAGVAHRFAPARPAHDRLQDAVVVARGAHRLPVAKRLDAVHRARCAAEPVGELVTCGAHIAVAPPVGRERAQRDPGAVAPHELAVVALVARELDRRRAGARLDRRPERSMRGRGRNEPHAGDTCRRHERQPPHHGAPSQFAPSWRNYARTPNPQHPASGRLPAAPAGARGARPYPTSAGATNLRTSTSPTSRSTLCGSINPAPSRCTESAPHATPKRRHSAGGLPA